MIPSTSTWSEVTPNNRSITTISIVIITFVKGFSARNSTKKIYHLINSKRGIEHTVVERIDRGNTVEVIDVDHDSMVKVEDDGRMKMKPEDNSTEVVEQGVEHIE